MTAVGRTPEGVSSFEGDAILLRNFWDRLKDYPSLAFVGRAEPESLIDRFWNSMGNAFPHYLRRIPWFASFPRPRIEMVLSSRGEALAYISSPAGTSDVRFERDRVRLRDLALAEGRYTMDLIKPDSGILSTKEISISDDSLVVDLPEFIDDIIIHLYEPAADE